MAQKSNLLVAGLISAFVLLVVGGLLASPALRKPAPKATSQATVGTPVLTPDRATLLAIRLSPGGTPTRDAELVNFRGTPAYEVILSNGTMYIDAKSGSLLASSAAVSPSTPPAVQSGANVVPVRYEGKERGHSEHENRRQGRDDDD